MLPPIRVLVVEDHGDWRKLVRLLFQMRPEWQIICEVADGLEAVKKAGELKPDLILLDIGLPKFNGIEAAGRIRHLAPNSKIVFLGMDNSLDTVQVALGTGGWVTSIKHTPKAIYRLLSKRRFGASDLSVAA